jgi:hypothetical protein
MLEANPSENDTDHRKWLIPGRRFSVSGGDYVRALL